MELSALNAAYVLVVRWFSGEIDGLNRLSIIQSLMWDRARHVTYKRHTVTFDRSFYRCG